MALESPEGRRKERNRRRLEAYIEKKKGMTEVGNSGSHACDAGTPACDDGLTKCEKIIPRI